MLLHDNEDGTLSERGEYAPQRRKKGHGADQASKSPKPAIIISQGPADPSSPPPVAPSYPPSEELSPAIDISGRVSITSSAPGPKEQPGSKGDQEALWSYLQPYLIKHRGPKPPVLGWTQQLITLPRIREIDWNTFWLSNHPFMDSLPRDVSALIIQVTGEPAPTPCSRCTGGRGPFKSCIMISPKAPRGPLQSIVSCANCFYHFGQTYCTNKAWGAERAKRILNARLGLGDDASSDHADSSSETENETIDEAEELVETHAMDDNVEGMDDDDDDGGASMSAGIIEAEPGRPYTIWLGENDFISSEFQH